MTMTDFMMKGEILMMTTIMDDDRSKKWNNETPEAR